MKMKLFLSLALFSIMIASPFCHGEETIQSEGLSIKITNLNKIRTTKRSSGIVLHLENQINRHLKVMLNVGGEKYKECKKADTSKLCSQALRIVTELEAGLKLPSINASLLARLTENVKLAGLNLEIPVVDDEISLNLKALFGDESKSKDVVHEYGAGLSIHF